MNKLRKILSVTVSIVLILVFTAQPFGIISSASDETDDYIGDYNYTIDNPYATVDWDNWGKFRANTHTHSHLSDGDEDFDEMIEKYYQLGYDCLAMTDHGTVNYGWTAHKSRHTEFQWSYVLHGDVHALSDQRNLEITTGVGRDGRGMIDVPYGIELNGASAQKVHVNSYFAPCGDGDMEVSSTWPESAVQKSQNAGALCHINHVGEWSGGQDSVSTYNADFVNRFSQLFINYSACIGMEVVNTADSRTQNDRYLYDETLKVLAPQGVKCWSFCEDDSHEYSDCGKNASFYMMPSNTAANVRTCMENGAFFASSKNAKGANELGGASASSSVDFPQVNRVSVDESNDQITFDTNLAKKARIVADGQLVDTINLSSSGDTVTIDLNKYDDYINSYVRIYFTGDGGITFVQPFYLTKTAVERPSVQLVTPSSDTIINVYNSLGNIVEKYNSDNYYLLSAGNYTYSASRQGYESLTNVPFTVTEDDIANCVQKKINVELQPDSGLLTAYFYVPETIYLNTSDLQSFQYFMDRQNAVDGALNSDLKTTGNVFFKCQGASDISVSYEILNGGTLDIEQSSASSDTLSTYVSSGTLSNALATTGSTQIKWTATYFVNGVQMHTYAYTYIYAPLIGTSGVAAAGGKAETHKTVSWLHTTMDVTGAAFISGVHNVSGGGSAYRFSPYGGQSVYACDGPGGASVSGYGYNTGEDDSDGGSTNANVTGGTATLYIDSSRTNNLNQIPNLSVGLDLLYADSCDDSGVTQYLNLGSSNLYTNSNGSATNIADGTRLYYANNNTSTKVNYAINPTISSINLVGQIQGKKSGRTCTSTNTIPLNFVYTNKTDLRNAISNSIKFAVQNEWCMQSASYDSYIDSIKNASLVLGNPTSNADSCAAAMQSLADTLKNIELQQASYTVEKYIDGQLYDTDTVPYTYGRNVSVYAANILGANYISMVRFVNDAEQFSTTDSEDTVFIAGENYTWKIYYSANRYNVNYVTTDDNYSPIGGSGLTVSMNSTLTLPTNVPEKTGYTFTGWQLNLDDKTYQPGDAILWTYDSDAEFTETWKTKSYTLTYDLNGGDPSSFTGDYTITVNYNTEFDLPANPAKSGYKFGGWKIGTDSQLLVGGMRVVWDYDTSLTCQAQWIPADNTSYTVYYYFQNTANNAYTIDSSKIYYGTGTTDSIVKASTPDYVGFTYNKNVGKPEGVITADGKLALTVFYTRNVYDLTINVDGDNSGSTTCTYNAQNIGTNATYKIKYGSTVPAISTATANNDLVFCGWWLDKHNGSPSEFISADAQQYTLSAMPNNNCTLTAVYQKNINNDANSGCVGKFGSIFDRQSNYLITETQSPETSNLLYLKTGFNVESTNTDNGFGTCSTIHVFDNNSNSQLFTLIVLGDVTGDGVVDVFDVSKCTSICNYEFDADNIETTALDSDSDGFVDVFDLAMLNAKANYEF